jgi:plastocyanin
MTQNPGHRFSTMIAIGAMLTGCSSYMSTNPQNSGDTKIQALPSLAFSPSSVTISSGETVTWVFGTVGETVIFDPVAGAPSDIGSVSSPQLNVSVGRTFSSAGSFTFHSSIHPSMTGMVIVSSNSISPPPPPAPPPPPPPGYGSRRPYP